MWIGDGVAVDEGCQLDARGCGPGEFRLGDGVLISRGCIVSGKDGPLAIGARVNIGAGCIMYASTRLEIGADTMLAAHCFVGGGRYGYTAVRTCRWQNSRSRDSGWSSRTTAGWVRGSVVVDGVRIGRGSVVGAGAVVTHDVEPYSVVAGVPARRVC